MLHELLAQPGCQPWPDMDHPATWTDDAYQDLESAISAEVRDVIRGLLHVPLHLRMEAAEAAAALQNVGSCLQSQPSTMAARSPGHHEGSTPRPALATSRAAVPRATPRRSLPGRRGVSGVAGEACAGPLT